MKSRARMWSGMFSTSICSAEFFPVPVLVDLYLFFGARPSRRSENFGRITCLMSRSEVGMVVPYRLDPYRQLNRVRNDNLLGKMGVNPLLDLGDGLQPSQGGQLVLAVEQDQGRNPAYVVGGRPVIGQIHIVIKHADCARAPS